MRTPANRTRGETVLEIAGRDVRLCLTLGALAELEATFDVASLAELGVRLAQLTAADLIVVIAVLARGGGETLASADIAAAEIDPRAAAHAVAECFRLALDD